QTPREFILGDHFTVEPTHPGCRFSLLSSLVDEDYPMQLGERQFTDGTTRPSTAPTTAASMSSTTMAKRCTVSGCIWIGNRNWGMRHGAVIPRASLVGRGKYESSHGFVRPSKRSSRIRPLLPRRSHPHREENEGTLRLDHRQVRVPHSR